MEHNNRSEILDVLKGILIIAVVIGHVASCKNIELDNNIPFLLCYSWHMFLFMGVSGYLCGKSKKGNRGWIVKRIKRLMIPLIAWAIVSSILDKDLSINRIFVYIFINPVYWYLFVQFVYEFIYFYCSKLRNKYLQIMCIICIGVGFAFVYKYIIACESIRQVLLYFPFYYGGLIISKHNEIKRSIDKVKWCSLFLYPISMIFYTWKDYTRVNEIITVMLQHMNVDSSAITKIIDMGMKGGYKIYNHYIVSPLGCAFYVCLAIIICCVSHDIYIRKVLAYIGENTMYIYILHKYFVASMLKLTNSIILSTIMVVIICIIITTIVKKMEIIDAIFFGGKKLQER